MSNSLFVLAFTGVPQVQLAPERGSANGRWDEVYRTLVALKHRSSAQRTCRAVALVECVRDRVHVGVAPVLIDSSRLAAIHAADESAGVECFRIWASQAPTMPDCCSAVQFACLQLFGERRWGSGSVHVFASEQELPDGSTSSQCYLPASSLADQSLDGNLEFVAKIVGSPVGWAQYIENERIPLLASALSQMGSSEPFPIRYVSLGATRLRVSQVVCADDALSLQTQSALSLQSIPRVAFDIDLGRQSLLSASACAHYFLVETMWFERRRDTPRHHVTFRWNSAPESASQTLSIECVECIGTVTSLDLESLRGNAELRAERSERGVGGAAAASTYLPAFQQLLCAPVSKPVGGVRLRVRARCDSTERLEVFTHAVVQWQLRCLCHGPAGLTPPSDFI